MWIATLFFGCNSYPSRFAKSRAGILSTDLYKLYINPLLDRLQDVGIGLKIGNINVNTGCADDIALLSTQLSDAQIMVNMALERFVLNFRRNRCECISLSNAAFAARSTRCPFCFSSVNILYASLSYICNISFLEVHLERVANSI
jgi:hypothetical protein